MQVKGKAQKMSDTYGHTSLKLLAHYDQNTSSWKMLEDTLALDLAQSLQTLPNLGMTQDGKLYELVMLVRPTKEQDFSLLPTPKVAGQGFNKSESKRNTPNLETTINLLPTPTAGDHKYRLQGKSQASQNLQALAILNLLPTPTAMHVRNHDEPIQAYEQRIMDYKEARQKASLGQAQV